MMFQIQHRAVENAPNVHSNLHHVSGYRDQGREVGKFLISDPSTCIMSLNSVVLLTGRLFQGFSLEIGREGIDGNLNVSVKKVFQVV
jgi:hypothetical protein